MIIFLDILLFRDNFNPNPKLGINMQYKLLGKSGLRVSELALGTMTFGEEWGWGSNKSNSKKVFDVFAKEGGNFIDTANRYTEGTSEKYVGEFINADREHFVLATKYTLFMRRDDPNFSGNHRKNMVQALDASLKIENRLHRSLLAACLGLYNTRGRSSSCAG